MGFFKYTIDYCCTDNFPWKEGERIRIKWLDGTSDLATITKIYTNIQWDKDVAYAVKVTLDRNPGHSFCCSHLLFEKIES